MNQLYSFSILVTGRCNLLCSYCHYYQTRDRKEQQRDLDRDTYSNYLEFVRRFIEEHPDDEVTYRFSGGEPTVLGDRLFEYSNLAFQITGKRPYVLTNGTALTPDYIARAGENNIGAFVISLENPVNPDKGSVDPRQILKMIRDNKNAAVPLYLGVTVVQNQDFSRIPEICDIVYSETGMLPKLHENNYLSYESPSDDQLNGLYAGLVAVVSKYHRTASMDFFPYVSPELCACHARRETFLMEMNLDNRWGIGIRLFSDKDSEFKEEIMGNNYVLLECHYENCAWSKACSTVKWLWKCPSGLVSAEQKIKDYCRLKKVVNGAFAVGVGIER